jgi:hypothetical protein
MGNLSNDGKKWRVESVHKWYRFYKLMPWSVRQHGQLGIGFRWIFDTFQPLLDIQIASREQWQKHSPSDDNKSQIAALRFYQRHLDSILLPVARKLVDFQNWALELKPVSWRKARENHRRALYRRENDIALNVPVGNGQLAFRPVPHEKISDASQNP